MKALLAAILILATQSVSAVPCTTYNSDLRVLVALYYTGHTDRQYFINNVKATKSFTEQDIKQYLFMIDSVFDSPQPTDDKEADELIKKLETLCN